MAAVTLRVAAVLAAAPDAPTPAPLVDVAAIAPGIVLDLRYAGAHNFVGRPVAGYGAPRCLLSQPAARALAAVEADLAKQRLGLMVYDCFRPQRAVADFVAWAGGGDTSTRARHYPAVAKSELFRRGYIAARSGHSRGSTVDVTLIRLPAPAQRSTAEPNDCRSPAAVGDASDLDDGSLNMGTAFDCFDQRAHGDYADLPAVISLHRRVLRHAMRRRGFLPYAREWWHFTLANEPFPSRYFDFDIR